MKTIVKLIGTLMLMSVTSVAYAGTDFYITINNNTDMDVTIQNVQTSCWYSLDFSNGLKISANSQKTLHTEDKASSTSGDFCGTSHRHMTYDLVGAHGVRYSAYTVVIRNAGPNDSYWGHDYKGNERNRDNDLGGPYNGDPVRFSVNVYEQLCNTSKTRYMACMFPDN